MAGRPHHSQYGCRLHLVPEDATGSVTLGGHPKGSVCRPRQQLSGQRWWLLSGSQRLACRVQSSWAPLALHRQTAGSMQSHHCGPSSALRAVLGLSAAHTPEALPCRRQGVRSPSWREGGVGPAVQASLLDLGASSLPQPATCTANATGSAQGWSSPAQVPSHKRPRVATLL